jgi:hypothetical protein
MRAARGRENKLPLPLTIGILILAFQCIGQRNTAIAIGKIVYVLLPHMIQVVLQLRHQRIRKHRPTILPALTVTNQKFSRFKIYILNSQAQTIEQT